MIIFKQILRPALFLNTLLCPVSAQINDNFANRISIPAAGGTVIGSSLASTYEDGEASHRAYNHYQTGSMWWTWTPTASGKATIQSVDGIFDGTAKVYTGASVSALTEVPSHGVDSDTFTFIVKAGTPYQIAADWIGDVLFIVEAPTGPVNDNFANRTPVAAAGGVVVGSNYNATMEVGEPYDERGFVKSVWWTWTPAVSGTAVIKSADKGSLPDLKVYTGASVNALTALPGLWDSQTGEFSFSVKAGTAYQIAAVADDLGGSAFGFSLTPPTGPANDDFAGRASVPAAGGRVTGSNVRATREGGEPAHGANSGDGTVWWTWTPTASGTAIISTEGGNFDTILAVYTGSSVGGLTVVRSNDDIPGTSHGSSRVAFNASAGTSYQIAVAGKYVESGGIVLHVVIPPKPSNDDFANRISIGGAGGERRSNNIHATVEPGEPDHGGGSGGGSVWWTWTPTVSGKAEISASSWPAVGATMVLPALRVYTGTELNGLNGVVPVSSHVEGATVKSMVNVTAGTAYHIAIEGGGGRTYLHVNPLEWDMLSGDWINRRIELTASPVGAGTLSGTGCFRKGSLRTVTAAARSGYTFVGWRNGFGVVNKSPSYGFVLNDDTTLEASFAEANDLFANRISIGASGGTVFGSNIHATKESGEPWHAGRSGGGSMWWTWTPTVSGTAFISTEGSSFDTTLAVYTGSSLDSLQVQAFNNDAFGGVATVASQVKFSVHAGTTYQIAVDGHTGGGRDANGVISLKVLPPPNHSIELSASPGDAYYLRGAGTYPAGSLRTVSALDDSRYKFLNWTRNGSVVSNSPNYTFALNSDTTLVANYIGAADYYGDQPEIASTGGTVSGTNIHATKESGEPAHAGDSGGKSVWWTWKPAVSGTAVISTAGSNFDTLLAVYAPGGSVSALPLKVENNDFNAGKTSQVSFTVSAGKTYVIAVDGFGGASGNIRLTVSPPPNYTIALRASPSAGGTLGGAGIYRGGTSRPVTASANSGYTFVNWTQNGTVVSTSPRYTFKLDGNMTLVANFTATPPPANNNFANRVLIRSAGGMLSASNVKATKQSGEPAHAGNSGGKSVWWTWTPALSGTAVISTAGSSFDTVLAVYTGSSLGALTLVRSNDDFNGVTSQVRLSVKAGTVYSIAVDGSNGASGNISLKVTPPAAGYRITLSASPSEGGTVSGGGSYAVGSSRTVSASASSGYRFVNWTQNGNVVSTSPSYAFTLNGNRTLVANFTVIPPPTNNNFTSRTSIRAAGGKVSGSNQNATKESGEPAHAGNSGGKSVWWTWTPTASGTAVVSTAGSNFDTVLAVYTGSSLGDLKVLASNDDVDGGKTSQVSFVATAGKAYRIAVDGHNGASGSIILKVTPP